MKIVVTDGITEFKIAAVENLPHAVEMMDSFHVDKLAGAPVEKALQRFRRETLGHRSRKKDLWYRPSKMLLTGEDLRS